MSGVRKVLFEVFWNMEMRFVKCVRIYDERIPFFALTMTFVVLEPFECELCSHVKEALWFICPMFAISKHFFQKDNQSRGRDDDDKVISLAAGLKQLSISP